jgi:outer membrane protein
MKKIIYLLILSAFCSTIAAQTDTLKLSLDRAIQLGLTNRFDVKKESLNINDAKNSVVKSKKELLPDLSASGKTTYYGDVQPSIIPAGYLGLTEPEKIAIGMKNNTAFALDLTYTIYKPGLYTDIKIAENNLALEKEKNRNKILNTKIEIITAYYNLLLKRLQYEIAKMNEQRYKEYYDLANGKYHNGAMIESDVMQAQLDYKNAQANVEKQNQDYLLSLQNLKYNINIPAQTVIIPTDSLQAMENSNSIVDLSANSVSNRSELKQLSIEQNGYILQLGKARQNYLPTLSLFGNYTQLFQGPDFNYSNNFYWAPVNYVGVTLSIPITGSIRNTNDVNDFKIKIAQANFEIKQEAVTIQYEIQQAITNLLNAEKNLQESQNNYNLSQKLYELKKQQYGLGSFSYENLLDTEKSLSTSEQEYITAVYDLLIAKINYQKAIGNY